MTQIHIRINGKHFVINDQSTIQEALESWFNNSAASLLTPDHYAIALNQHFIPRTQYACTALQAGDDLELLAPMSGG